MKKLTGKGVRNGSVEELMEERDKGDNHVLSIWISEGLEREIDRTIEELEEIDSRSEFFRKSAVEYLEKEDVAMQILEEVADHSSSKEVREAVSTVEEAILDNKVILP